MPIKEFESLWHGQWKVIKTFEDSPGESYDQIYISGIFFSPTERMDCEPGGREKLKDITMGFLCEMQ